MPDTDLTLAFDLAFSDLYDEAGLARVDQAFRNHLDAADAALALRLDTARADAGALDAKAESDLLLALSPHVDAFVARLFGIEEALGALHDAHTALDALYACKRLFVQRLAVKKYAKDAETIDGAALETDLAPHMGGALTERAFAQTVMGWMDDEDANAGNLDIALRYAAWATLSDAGKTRHADDILFRVPGKLDFDHLVEAETVSRDGVDMLALPADKQHPRDGFALTDEGCDLTGALDQTHYCVICHERGKDSCSKGMRDKKTGAFQKNPLGTTLTGCPLEEKISEMHKAKQDGFAVAALAIIAADNPMAAATGHRICNDCMQACIYQKQDPVNIPEAETRTLKDVLALPFGFEIYSLLTRWNPMNIRQSVAKAASGKSVLVVGLGPAGFTLAHYLLNQGHTVVAIDGAKIEPVDESLSGISAAGGRVPFAPIRDINEVCEPLDERIMAGFGGVAEYGITVRWNKNFLTVIRLLLERRSRFRLYGGVRFGAQVTKESAFNELGFDHVALCLGAGKPTILGIPNGLAPGVRQASDFLMALQLTGAAKRDSLANLQLRLPAVVIGGGLTAIDTATEALAYYVTQVEKFLDRYETLAGDLGEDAVRAGWSVADTAVADDFIAHGKAVRTEREQAARDGRAPDFAPLLDRWGGATIAYRRRLADAPSYTLNPEEVTKALEQGIRIAELLSPTAVEVDEHGHAAGLTVEKQAIGDDGRPKGTGETLTLPARAVLVAAGTKPNTTLSRERPDFAHVAGQYFQAVDETGTEVTPDAIAKPDDVRVLMCIEDEGHRAMSFFGDLHPSFAGNVVKAMASAKQGWPVVEAALARADDRHGDAETLFKKLDAGLRATVHEVKRLTPTIAEVIIHAPFAARAFKPGQFFRLQNFETMAPVATGVTHTTRMAMEGLALTGAWVDVERGLVSVIVLEMGGSSDLTSLLKPGEPVVLMGPTGMPTETPANETVILAGGGLGNAVLFSIGQAFRAAGSRVLYFAGYKKMEDRYHVDDIEAAADAVVWCSDEAPGFKATRAQDKTFVGNIVDAMAAYGSGALGDAPIAMTDADRLIAIGSDAMMKAVHLARSGVLKDHLKPGHIGIGSINSPMQCMMKEICAQCLQRHIDPDTGEETVVFSCFNQDQPLDRVDFSCLRDRLSQNALAEKLTKLWIKRAVRSL